jgi:hypothetical protein
VSQYITNSQTLVNILIMSTLGNAIIVQTLNDALCYMKGKRGRNSEFYKDAFLYVKGSGLEITIEEYGLAYDGEKLRDQFFWFAKQAMRGSM